jgi:phospho-N-acetylmuramoyl-pentapeptide-transferase
MARVIVAAIVAMVISIVVGPKLIEFLRRRELGQHIREEGPQQHVTKQGTPTMGGILVLVSSSVAFLVLSRYTTAALTVFLSTVLCGAIGFLDDFIKLTHRRSLGLSGRWKLLMLAGTSALIAWLANERGLDTNVYIPIADWELPLSWLWYPFLFFVVAGAANGVNLTDGLDGLAAGTGTIAIFTVTVMAV